MELVLAARVWLRRASLWNPPGRRVRRGQGRHGDGLFLGCVGRPGFGRRAAARLLPSARVVARELAHLLDAEDLLPDGGVGPVRPARSHQAFPNGGGVYQGTGLPICRGPSREPQDKP
jgi:hypothetical protein